MSNTTRVVLYARVSTKDQSADMQIADLRRFAQARGWQVAGEFVDSGVSGAKTSRPEFDRMMEALRRRDADLLACWRFDRVGRSTQHLLAVLEELRALNLGFCSVTEGIDTVTPTGKMVFTFLAALAEFERALIRERVCSGIQSAKARGIRFGRPRAGLDAGKAVEMRAAGVSFREIGRCLHVSPSTVVRAVAGVMEAVSKPHEPKDGVNPCQKAVS